LLYGIWQYARRKGLLVLVQLNFAIAPRILRLNRF